MDNQMLHDILRCFLSILIGGWIGFVIGEFFNGLLGGKRNNRD